MNGQVFATTFFIIVFSLLALFLCRGIILWFFGIDKIISLLKQLVEKDV